LINTKKGKAGDTAFDFRIYEGAGRPTRMVDMLNTKQYLQMRREAFANDGVTPVNGNAYDLLVWDTTAYTDFKKLLTGGTAHSTDVTASVSGGNEQTQFLIGGGYHRETTVYPGDFNEKRASLHFNINHKTSNNKFLINLSGSYSYNKNNLLINDLTKSIK